MNSPARAWCRALLVLTFSATALSSGFAQITAATVSGTVKDETGAVLPGADIVVKNLDTGLTRTAVTNDQGFFTVPGLPPGKYETRASLPGFTTGVQAVVLAVAQEAGLIITLKVGITEESINVVASAALVDTRSSALSALVPEKTIEELPLNGRNYISLALLQPGVLNFVEKNGTSSSTKGMQLNINGMGGRSNSYLLDGANMRGYAGIATVSAADSTLGVETIREFRIVTNAFSADYGRAMGGIVNIASKSGSNEFHGSAFEFFRDSKMDARNFFDGTEVPPFRRNQFGAAGGGPLRKNKIFFYGGLERLQEDLGITQPLAVPSVAVRSGALVPVNPTVQPYLDLFPLPNGPDLGQGAAQFNYAFNRPTRENFGQVRADVILSEKDTLFGRLTVDKAAQLVTSNYPGFSTDSTSNNQFYTLEEKKILTSALLNTVRVSHSRLRFEQIPMSTVPASLAFISGVSTAGVMNIGGLTPLSTGLGPDNTLPSTNNNTYYTFSDDVSYSKGNHLLKLGALIEHASPHKESSTNLRGTYNFADLRQFLLGNPFRFTGLFPGASLVRKRPNTLFGFYVQDDYRVTSRVTLNLGARYEFFTVPRDTAGRDTALRNVLTDAAFTVGPPFVNPSLKNFAPRLGFAWDVGGDGRTAVRGGAGVYYDTDGTFNSSFGITQFSPPFSSQIQVSNPQFPHPSLDSATSQIAARTLDYHVKQPAAVTFNVNVQRELVGDLVAMIGYAGSRGNNLVSAIEANPVVPVVRPDGTLSFRPGTPRRNPNFGSVDYRTSGGRSQYNALQSSLVKHFSKGYQVQASYTFATSTDNTQAQLNQDAINSSVYAQNPYDRNEDRGPSDFDTRHTFSANFTWELPGGKNALLRGWQFNGIVTLRSGLPFSPSLGSVNWSGSGNNSGEDRPSLRPGVDVNAIVLGGPDKYFDPTAFVLQPKGTFGNAGRNMLRGPRFADADVSLVRNLRVARLGAGGGVQLRLELFNVLNRPNFGVPNRQVFAALNQNEAPLSTAGRMTRTVNPSRQVQLGVKLLF